MRFPTPVPGSADNSGVAAQLFKPLHGVKVVQCAPIQRIPRRENSRKADGECKTVLVGVLFATHRSMPGVWLSLTVPDFLSGKRGVDRAYPRGLFWGWGGWCEGLGWCLMHGGHHVLPWFLRPTRERISPWISIYVTWPTSPLSQIPHNLTAGFSFLNWTGSAVCSTANKKGGHYTDEDK